MTTTDLLEKYNGLSSGHRQGCLMYQFWTEAQARGFAEEYGAQAMNRNVWVDEHQPLSNHWYVLTKLKSRGK